MTKITPKFRTVLLIIFLTGSYVTTYANAISSFLTPTETDTSVSFFTDSVEDESPIFQNYINNLELS